MSTACSCTNPPTCPKCASHDTRQLVLSGVVKETGALQDLTGDVQFEVADSKILRVTSGGRVMPLANGSTTITARYGDKSATITVTNESMDQAIPISLFSLSADSTARPGPSHPA